MLETAINAAGFNRAQPAEMENGGKKVLRWRVNERMGGKVPVWEEVKSPQEKVARKLAMAGGQPAKEDFESAMAYADGQADKAVNTLPAQTAQEFGFGDLVDMVNPLQHIPVVGRFYREMTGDEIKPIARIIGGGIFAGPVGAAGNLVNTIVEYETGKDVAGNMVAFALNGDKPDYRSERLAHSAPQENLNETLKKLKENPHDLPGTVIGFSDLGQGRREIYERVPAANGRTAGTMLQKRADTPAPAPPREPVTQMAMNPLPLLLEEEREN